MNVSPRIVGAAFGALAALGIGGAGLAWAQEAPTTTPSTEVPAAGEDTAPAADEDCPEKGDRAGRSGDAGAPATDQISL